MSDENKELRSLIDGLWSDEGFQKRLWLWIQKKDSVFARAQGGDVICDAFVRFYENPQLLKNRTRGGLKAAIYLELRGALTKHRREKARSAEMSDLDSRASPEVLQDEQVMEQEMQQIVRSSIEELSGRDQSVAWLLLEDPPPTNKELSDRLGRPFDTVKSQRARVYQRLRQIVKKKGLERKPRGGKNDEQK